MVYRLDIPQWVQTLKSESPPGKGRALARKGRALRTRGSRPAVNRGALLLIGHFVPESDEVKVQDTVAQIDSHADQHDAAKEVQDAQGLLTPFTLEPAGGELSEGPGCDQHGAVAQCVGEDQAEGEQEPA